MSLPELPEVAFPSSSALHNELLYAAEDLSSVGLWASARWASELLASMADGSSSVHSQPLPSYLAPSDRDSSFQEKSSMLLARSFFNLREYGRVKDALQGIASSPRAIFMKNYATFLLGEKLKEELMVERSGSAEIPVELENSLLAELKRELWAVQRESASRQEKPDGFLLFLMGIICREMKDLDRAAALFCQSVNAYPLNWSAWCELAAVIDDISTIADALPEHWCRNFFIAHWNLQLQHNDDALEYYQALSNRFPRSSFLLSELALCYYNMRDYDTAEQLFEAILVHEPHRLDGMDTFSNILYVKEAKVRLSALAQNAVALDKYRPETCCIIGNYLSLKGNHTSAVAYFKRALRLNRRYLSAWTLMGHEYVELKNTAAAIESYRHAVEVNPRDYRAWYGLGQTYEILQLPFYALYYYRRSAQLRPYDGRMWTALAGCYEGLNRAQEAIKCYERAATRDDSEGLALTRLAKLHREIGEDERAAAYYKKILQNSNDNGTVNDLEEVSDSLMFLAAYSKQQGQLEEAHGYAAKLLDYPSGDREAARALLREIQSLREQHGSLSTSVVPAGECEPLDEGSDDDMEMDDD